MRKEIKDLLAEMKAKKEEVRAFVADGKLEDAERAKGELIELQKKFDLLADLDEEEHDKAKDSAENGKMKDAAGNAKPTKEDIGNAFVNLIRCTLRKTKMSRKDTDTIEYLDSMNEGTSESDESDGDFTVPSDIDHDIRELRRSADNLEQLVNVEFVTTKDGARTIEKEADSTPWNEVGEEEDFGDTETPKLVKIKYVIKKFGGILKVSRELLEDTAANILAYLKRWIAKKTKATRNAKILSVFDAITEAGSVQIRSFDELKDIFNVALDPAIAAGACVVTNQDGFNALDKWKDKDGNYILQKDPVEKTKRLLFGMYPVTVLSNKTLKTAKVYDVLDNDVVVGYKYPIYCGDPREAVTLFDRRIISIDISSVAGDLWKKDQTGIKVRDRFDAQAVDGAALKKGYVASGKQTAGGEIAVSGTLTVGQKLTAVINGITPPDAQTTLTYKWQRGATATGAFTDIASAASNEYTLASADQGKYIKLIVTVGGTSYQGIFEAVSTAAVA